MKPKTQSVPPAPTGGLTEAPTTAEDAEASTAELQPPATVGGPDLSTLQAENADLKAAIRLKDAQASVTSELGKSGARSPELLWNAIRESVEFDADGKPVNTARLIAELRAKYPEQFGADTPPSIDAGAGQSSTPRLTKAALARMKPDEIARLDWSEVRRVLAA